MSKIHQKFVFFRVKKEQKFWILKLKKTRRNKCRRSHDGYSRYKKLNPYKKLDFKDDSLKLKIITEKKAVSRFIFDSKTTINIVNKNLFETSQGSKKKLLEIINESPA